MNKLKINDSTLEICNKMAMGNTGAISAISELFINNARIDPESVLKNLSAIITLDDLEIYGTDIYILWSDKCGRDTRCLIMLLRAVQLGILSHIKLKEMSEDQIRKINLTEKEFAELDEKVCNELTGFEKS